MMMLGERVPAAKALDWGMIHKVVADDALDAEALALAERLAAGPTVALGLMRQRAADTRLEVRLCCGNACTKPKTSARARGTSGFDGGRHGLPAEAQAGVPGGVMRANIQLPPRRRPGPSCERLVG